MSASKQASKRLGKEYQAIQKEPPPFVLARPFDSNILEWHFILRGPSDTEYAGGEYYGVVLFPPDYPFKPPGIKVLTPSGRFQPNTGICTSMSNFHPGSWNPAWSVSTILTGLLSFMLAEEMTTGSIRSTAAEKKTLAAASHAWNRAHPKFKKIFPDYSGPVMLDLPDMGPQPPTPSLTPSSDIPVLALPLINVTTPDGEVGLIPPDQPARRSIGERVRGPLLWALGMGVLSWAAMKVLDL